MVVVVGKNQNEEAYDDDDQKEKLKEVRDKNHLVLECMVVHVYYDVN